MRGYEGWLGFVQSEWWDKTSYVTLIDPSLQFFVDNGRESSPEERQKKLTADERRLTYQTFCGDAPIRLKARLFDEDRT